MRYLEAYADEGADDMLQGFVQTFNLLVLLKPDLRKPAEVFRDLNNILYSGPDLPEPYNEWGMGDCTPGGPDKELLDPQLFEQQEGNGIISLWRTRRLDVGGVDKHDSKLGVSHSLHFVLRPKEPGAELSILFSPFGESSSDPSVTCERLPGTETWNIANEAVGSDPAHQDVASRLFEGILEFERPPSHSKVIESTVDDVRMLEIVRIVTANAHRMHASRQS